MNVAYNISVLMYYIHYTVLSTQCTFTKLSKLDQVKYCIMYTIYTRQYTMYTIYTIQYTMYTIYTRQYTMYTIYTRQYTMYTIYTRQYTMYTIYT